MGSISESYDNVDDAYYYYYYYYYLLASQNFDRETA